MSDYDAGGEQSSRAGNAGKAIAKTATRKGARSGAKWIVAILGVKGFAIVGAILLVLLLIVAAGAAAKNQAAAAASPCGGTSVHVTGGDIPGLAADQATNARAIAGVALGLGLGRQGVLIGVLTADVEADLHNLDHGDRDSVGLYQQRTPWGPTADRMNPVKSATMFFTGGQGGQPGLLDITGWQTMDPGVAMQAVQESQFSGGTSPGYAAKLAQATAATDALMAGLPPVPVAAPAAVACGSGLAPGAIYSPPGLEQNNSQDPTTYGWQLDGPLEPLVYQGHSFGQVAKGTVKLWTAMLNELVPLIPGGLNNDLGCYERRPNRNNPGVWSLHAYGLACDLNSGVNCNGCVAQSLQGQKYALPMAAHDVLARYCMQWGGDFRGTPDPMHAEIHCTPVQIAAWSATQP